MIIFKRLRYKNFLSAGNNYTEINLNENPATLVVGSNGSGKSTILDALSFGLFGKPHRNINKPQLVNSINDKDLEVVVDFQVGKNTYNIVRGIKPNKFEIYKNDELIPQASNIKDYQSHLENSILKLNHKVFHQVVVLGSSSFVPFMQLPAAQRRAVIEDLLDINIFTSMNQILKETDKRNKEGVRSLEYECDVLENKIDTQKTLIKNLENISIDLINDKEEIIKETGEKNEALVKRGKVLSQRIQDGSNEYEKRFKKATENREKWGRFKSQHESAVTAFNKELSFYNDNTSCPTCEQEFEEQSRLIKIEEAIKKLEEARENATKGRSEVTAADSLLNQLRDIKAVIDADKVKLVRINGEISSNNEVIKAAKEDIKKLKSTDDTLENSKNILSQMEQDIIVHQTSKAEISEEITYTSVVADMLKDSGIKTKIIKQYLPVMNKLVNEYLDVLDFFVLFTLDDNFNETIRSRHRDIFSYDSFSEGEKQRIDLSLLFTWRQIAKMKNSISTNLLVLDETFDSSLDTDGVDNLLTILNTLDKSTNVFVISHKGDQLDSKFPNKISFSKMGNFSKISVH